MSSFSALKTAIQAAIKQNGNNEITGDILQDILLSIVSTLGDSAINNLETGLSSEASTRGNADTTLQTNINNEATARQNADTQLNNLITGIKNNIDNGYVYAGIATPSTTPVSGKVFYIATQAGTYTNLGNTAVKPGISILKYNGSTWSNEQVNYTDGGVFDVSAYNGGATYASLEALLSAANLSTIIPSAVRKGGMSIKFVQSSDNKYVKFFCTADEFTTDETKWQGVDDEPTAGSNNLVKSGGVYKSINNLKVYKKYTVEDFSNDGYVNAEGAIASSQATLDWKHTDYIPIIEGLDIQCWNCITDSIHSAGIAFYASNVYTSFISGIINQQPHGTPFTIKSSDIPEGAKYVIFSSYTGYEDYSNTWAAFIYDDIAGAVFKSGEKAEEAKNSANNAQTSANNAQTSANNANNNALAAKELAKDVFDDVADNISVYEETLVSGLDDRSYSDDSNLSYGVAEYTRPVETNYFFNKLQIRGIRVLSGTFDYKVYLYKGVSSAEYSYAPTGTISDGTHKLIKSGTITPPSATFEDYTIELGKFVGVARGQQVVVYLAASNKVSVRGHYGIAPEGVILNRTLTTAANYADVYTSSWNAGGAKYNSESLYLYLKPVFVTSAALDILREQIEEEVQEELEPVDLEIQIPNIIYAVEGVELNIYNDAISFSIDKGLDSPTNYYIEWICSVGLVTKRGYRFTPSSTNVGNTYYLICYLYNQFGKQLKTKTIALKVLSKSALSSTKRIVHFGDSIGAGTATALYQDFHDSNKFTGSIPVMLGTQGVDIHHEAVGGYKWASFATEGRIAYRASVNNVTSLALGAIYEDAFGYRYSISEVNITDGAGNILLAKSYNGSAYGDLPLPSGTLTKYSGGGDDTLPYTDAFEESANPLWNSSTQQLDIEQYKQKLVSLGQLSSVSDKIDAVSFQLGGNDRDLASDLPTMLGYIDALYHCFVDDNPNCKFIIGLTTTSGNTIDGAGANYGASWNNDTYKKQINIIRNFYLSLQNSASYPNIRIAPIAPELDRYYGYGFSARRISQRFDGVTALGPTGSGISIVISPNEVYHNNCVHPATSGYGQLGDAYFAEYIGVLTE